MRWVDREIDYRLEIINSKDGTLPAEQVNYDTDPNLLQMVYHRIEMSYQTDGFKFWLQSLQGHKESLVVMSQLIGTALSTIFPCLKYAAAFFEETDSNHPEIAWKQCLWHTRFPQENITYAKTLRKKPYTQSLQPVSVVIPTQRMISLSVRKYDNSQTKSCVEKDYDLLVGQIGLINFDCIIKYQEPESDYKPKRKLSPCHPGPHRSDRRLCIKLGDNSDVITDGICILKDNNRY